IGRMMITLMLWNAGLISAPHFYISGYLEEEKDQYIDYMRNVSQSDDWSGWIVFFLEAVEKQAVKNLQIAESIRALYEEMKGTFRELLDSKYCLNALDFVFTNPIYRNNRFSTVAGIPTSTAAKFTKILLDHKLIVPIEAASG